MTNLLTEKSVSGEASRGNQKTIKKRDGTKGSKNINSIALSLSWWPCRQIGLMPA